jgi:hypothetical protein
MSTVHSTKMIVCYVEVCYIISYDSDADVHIKIFAGMSGE